MADELDPIAPSGGVEQATISDTPAEAPAPAPSEASPPAEKEPKKLSLREELTKNIAESKKPPKSVPVGERLKDPDTGKFVAKEKDAVEAPKADAPAKEIPTAKDAQPDKQVSTPVGPPPGWSKESKELFKTLPASIQADVAKRENEISNGFKQYSDKAKRYDEIDAVLAPARSELSQLGIRSDAQAINTLLQWERFVRTNPKDALLQLAQSRGIDLSTLAQSSSGQPSAAAPDISAQLRPVLDPINQQVQSVQSEIQNIRHERISSELATFAKDHPHFEKVRVRMGQLIAAGAVQPNDLENAYQQAVWADPDIRNEMMAEKVNEQLKAQQAAAAKARAAAVSVFTRAPSGPVVNGAAADKAKGVRGSILAAVNEVQERNRA